MSYTDMDLTATTATIRATPFPFKPQIGDVFATSLSGMLGKLIKLGERVKSDDCEAFYSHTGIILKDTGETFEALWTIRRQNLFEAYCGVNVLVARYKDMDIAAFNRGFHCIKGQEGNIYPVGRLFLHMLNLAKLHLPNRMVCSELTACFLIMAGAQTMGGRNCYGITPDELVDEWRISKYFDIVYEGKI